MKIIYFFFFALSVLLFGECVNPSQPPPPPSPSISPLDYQQYVLPDKPIEHGDIPKFAEKAELGKVLFFTKINGSACADCHSPKHGFTAGQQQSCGRGCEGVIPNRKPIPGQKTDTPPIKSPSSIGVFGSETLLWTGLAGSKKDPFEGLVHAVIGQAEIASGENAHDMRVSADSIQVYHPAIFEQFKDVYTGMVEEELCDPVNVAECLAAFQMRLIPNDSQFQKWLKGEMEMSAKAQQGLKIFDAKCAGCHRPPFLGDDKFMDVGFPHLVNDIHDGTHKVKDGHFLVTGKDEDKGKFRVMRLATNVASHICWGHGGTFKTLEDCIAGHQNIDSVSVDEIGLVVEFLNMTTDRTLLNMKPD